MAENVKQKKSKKKIFLCIIALLVIILSIVGVFYLKSKKNNKNESVIETEVDNTNYENYRLTSNSLEDFDLYFLQLENQEKNKIYSPLSIKYALAMLNEGAKGKTKEQISNIIGDYNAKKYVNNANMSFANALFVKNTFKNSIKSTYVDSLLDKYNAEVVYDEFKTSNTINNWVSNKTFKLINNIIDDTTKEDLILVNALAIDMEWVNKIQNEDDMYEVNFYHEKYSKQVIPLRGSGYYKLLFDALKKNVQSVEFAAVANKYDIVKTLGEEEIRKTVGKEYEKWIAEGACGDDEELLDTNTYLDRYIKMLNTNYNHLSSSTDFQYYDDENVKIFAKDLKEYAGTTLQYIGIMPKKETLAKYIEKANALDINTLINNLKPIELSSFKDGVITEVFGYIPTFKFDYELGLMKDLKKLGITNVFNSKTSDLSNLTTSKTYINKAVHKANIEFTNDGIKASAVTLDGGFGDGGCEFDYLYDVPVEKIDLTFNKPYMFLIRDKNSKEVWFVGTVYEPDIYQQTY